VSQLDNAVDRRWERRTSNLASVSTPPTISLLVCQRLHGGDFSVPGGGLARPLIQFLIVPPKSFSRFFTKKNEISLDIISDMAQLTRVDTISFPRDFPISHFER